VEGLPIKSGNLTPELLAVIHAAKAIKAGTDEY
jgi:hypothetical protein